MRWSIWYLAWKKYTTAAGSGRSCIYYTILQYTVVAEVTNISYESRSELYTVREAAHEKI